MLFDRIVEDSLGFIRRMLWSREDSKIAKKPFQTTHSKEGELGFIYLLEGRDTPRAVRTWMYSPKRKNLNSTNMVMTSTPTDLHIYIDFLGPLPKSNKSASTTKIQNVEEPNKLEKSVNTHRLQILKASHFLNAEGLYNCELVFWKEFNFHPFKGGFHSKGNTVNKIAAEFTDTLALKCLKIANPLKLKAEDWEEVIAEMTAQAKQNNDVE